MMVRSSLAGYGRRLMRALLAGQPLRITQSACHAIAAPTAVIALGKAAGAMAEGARAAGVTAPGIIITTDENHRQIDGFDCVAASHPVPDRRGLACRRKGNRSG